MKCPIKKLEDECIAAECPFFCNGSCGLHDLVLELGGAAESIQDELQDLNIKMTSICEVLWNGLKRL